MKWSNQSNIVLHPYKSYPEKKNFIVELIDTEDFFEMPPICIDALKLLQQGSTVAEVEGVLVENYPEEDVDLQDFIEQLLELGMIHKIDNEIVRPTIKKSDQQEREISQGLSYTLGKLLFSKPMLVVYTLLFILNISIFILNPSVFPSYMDIFIFDSMSLNILNLALVTLFIITFHELGHVLAVRKYNLPTKLGIGHRLFLVVVETEMTHVWKLSRRQRNVPFLAGMCFDQILLFLALIAQIFLPGGHYIFLGVAGVIVFEVFILFIYQCCFYMKTDVYYVLENMLGSYNLLENSKEWLNRGFQKLTRTRNQYSNSSVSKIVKSYAIFYVLGMLISLGLAILFFIPQLYYSISASLQHLSYPMSNGLFWDGVIFLLNLSIMLLLLLYSWYRKYLKRVEGDYR